MPTNFARWPFRRYTLRVAFILPMLFGMALISRLRVLLIWGAGPAANDAVGIFFELLVATLVAVVIARLNNLVCTLVAVCWALMCVIDMENLLAMREVANLENIRYLFDADFLVMTLSAATVPHLASTALSLLLPVVLFPWALRRIDSRAPAATAPPWRVWILLPVTLGALLLVPGLIGDGAGGWRGTSFAQIHGEQLAEMAYGALHADRVDMLPGDEEVMGWDLSGEPTAHGTATNVLLVVLEGLTGAYVKPVADFFGVTQPLDMTGLSAIADDSLIVPNFLTHKQLTIRGLYSILCGDYPKLGGGTPKALEMLESSATGRDCLPAVLADHGFRTTFFQAAPLEYMSKSTVMPHIGFEEVRGQEAFRAEGIEIHGWGPRDHEFLEHALPMVEELDAGGAPWFATLLTVGTHFPFDVEPREIEAYGSAKNAAVEAADAAIAQFVGELVDHGIADDTLIIITSDESHGVPHHPHGTAWGLMVARGPGIGSDVNPGVFGSVDTMVSVLDFLGIEPPDGTIGRSFFRRYPGDRTMPFAVGRDPAITTRRGEFHLCRPRSPGSIVRDDVTSRCQTYFTETGEMFAGRYLHRPAGEHRDDYRRLYRLQGLLDGSVSREVGGHRLVLTRNAVSRIHDSSDFELVSGQSFHVPTGSSARVSIKLRYEAEGDIPLIVQHHWLAEDGAVSDGRDRQVARFVVPAVWPGGILRLVFEVGELGDDRGYMVIAKASCGAGRVTVEEYSIEFVDGDREPGGPIALLDGKVRYPGVGVEKLVDVPLTGGWRAFAGLPRYRTGSTIDLTDSRELARFTLMDGWWPAESWAAWSRASAHIYLNLDRVDGAQVFTIRMVGYDRADPAERRVDLRVNGRDVVTWEVAAAPEAPFTDYSGVIAGDALHEGVNVFVLEPRGGLTSPSALGRSNDARTLGVGVRSFSLSPADAS